MRDVLLKQVRPLVEQLAADLVDLAVARVEAEIERVKESLEVAVSSYASDGPELAGLRALAEYRQFKRKKAVRGGASRRPARIAVPEPAVAAEQGSASRVTIHFDKVPSPPSGLIERTLGPDIARALGEPVADRDTKPENLAQPRLRKDGHRLGVTVCSRCGYVGGNARGCGKPTGHPSRSTLLHTRPEQPTPYEVAKSKVDRTPVPLDITPPPVRKLKPTAAALEDRKAIIAERRAAGVGEKPAARAPEPELHEYDPDNLRPGQADPDALYALPAVRSSWGF